MRRIRSVGLVALLGTSACYSYVNDSPAAPQWEPVIIAGPPGGAIDPGYGYQQSIYEDPPAQASGGQLAPADPVGAAPAYEGGVIGGVGGGELGAAPEAIAPGQGEAPAAPQDPTGADEVIGSVTDEEIDSTLAPYGV